MKVTVTVNRDMVRFLSDRESTMSSRIMQDALRDIADDLLRECGLSNLTSRHSRQPNEELGR